jgi:PAS domain S-box-containing protein
MADRPWETVLEAIFEASAEAIMVADPEGRITHCNRAALHLYGFTSTEDFLGRPLSMLVASQFREALGQALQRKDQTSQPARWTLLTKDCQEFPAEVCPVIVRDHTSKPVAVALVARDITAYEQAEQALRDSEERYRAVIETTDTGFVALDERGRVLIANPNYARLAGHSTVTAILGRQVLEWTAPHDVDRNRLEILRCLEQGAVQNLEIEYQHVDGTLVPVEINASVVQTRTGRMVVTLCRDISERKRMERHVQRVSRMYALLSDVNQAIVRIRQPQTLWETVCRIAVDQGGFRMAWVGLANDTTHKVEVAAHAGMSGEYLSRLDITLDETPRGQGPAGRALREGRHVICNDILHDPCMGPWRQDALNLGYRSSASFPLTWDGKVRGAISLYGSEPGLFDEDEVRLLDEMAMDISFAMEFAENESRRRQADAQLRQLAARHEAILTEIPDIIMEVNAERVYTWANPAGHAFFGDDVVGKEAAFYFEGEQDTYQHVQPLFNGDASLFYVESWQRRKDGQKRLLAWRCQALKDAEGRVTGALSTARDVTEQREMEEALRVSESFLASVIAQSPHAIWISDSQGTLIRLNQACRDLLHVSDDEVVGKYNVLKDDIVERQGFMPLVRRVFKAGETARFELEYDSSQLRHLCLEHFTSVILDVMIFPIKDARGKVCNAVIQHTDITARKRAEQALQEREQRYRRLLELAGDAILVVDAETGTFVEANRMAEQLLGLTRDELLGKHFTQVHPPEDEGRYRRLFKWCMEHPGGVLSSDLCVIHRDGHRVPVEICSGVMEWAGRKVVQGIFRDLSERRQVEQALRESEERFHLAVQGSNDGLWDWPDMSRDHQWWSPRFYELLGCTPDEIESNNTAFNNLVHPEDLDHVMAVARGPSDPDKPFDVEFRLKVHSGEYRWFSSRGAVVRSEEGRPIRMCGSIRDITDRRKAQAERATYQARLKSLTSQVALAEERERRRIAVGVHDDIGQKLVLAKLELQSLRHTVPKSAAAKGLDRVCDLIDQSMQDARSLAFELSNPVLYEVGLDAAIESWLGRQIGERAGIQCEFESELEGVKLDETTSVVLFQAVREVLTNIVKHAQATHVKTRIYRNGPEVCVAIEDNGVGFDPAVLAWSADRQRGVGLFNVQERLEYFKGRLAIRSSPGQGTMVTLSMPFKTAPPVQRSKK